MEGCLIEEFNKLAKKGNPWSLVVLSWESCYSGGYISVKYWLNSSLSSTVLRLSMDMFQKHSQDLDLSWAFPCVTFYLLGMPYTPYYQTRICFKKFDSKSW